MVPWKGVSHQRPWQFPKSAFDDHDSSYIIVRDQSYNYQGWPSIRSPTHSATIRNERGLLVRKFCGEGWFIESTKRCIYAGIIPWDTSQTRSRGVLIRSVWPLSRPVQRHYSGHSTLSTAMNPCFPRRQHREVLQ